MNRFAADLPALIVALAVLAATVLGARVIELHNATTISLAFLLAILFTATLSRLWVAVVVSIAAMLCINFFFLPPISTFTIADPQNWVALFAFLAVSLVASRLSTTARDRQRDALARRDELARLFELSRDILLSTESADAVASLVRHIATRFELHFAAIYLPAIGGFERFETGAIQLPRALAQAELDLAMRADDGTTVRVGAMAVRLTPLRVGTRAIGLLATIDGVAPPATLAALAGIAAIAIERAHFLEERKQAELAQRSAELKSHLLASLAHDLRTPLTAIRIAAENLAVAGLSEVERAEQRDVALTEVARLSRLFQNILEMSTIDSGTVAPMPEWVHPMAIVEAAEHQIASTMRDRKIRCVDSSGGDVAYLDPRLTANALAHVLENAAQYSPTSTVITVTHQFTAEGLLIAVEDQGPGIAPQDLPHLFDRYYRGAAAAGRRSGAGMGLAIAKGLIEAEGGRLWAENVTGGGARFLLFVPADHRAVASAPDAASRSGR